MNIIDWIKNRGVWLMFHFKFANTFGGKNKRKRRKKPAEVNNEYLPGFQDSTRIEKDVGENKGGK